MRVRWSEDADRDRAEIIEDIWLDNPTAAKRMEALFEAAAAKLERFPHMGRPGVLAGTRELIPHSSYRLVYEIRDEEIVIHALIHTARRWPPKSVGEGG